MNRIEEAFKEIAIEELEELANYKKVSLDTLYVYDVDIKAFGGEMHFDIFQANLHINIEDQFVETCVYIANTEEVYANSSLKGILNDCNIEYSDF
nr:hypothetical protein [Moritella viscosa]SHO15152.1 DNA-directed RNA polymerase subunit beta-RNA polymerase subunit beta-Transcriptase subunit beta [Moritella viscosa]